MEIAGDLSMSQMTKWLRMVAVSPQFVTHHSTAFVGSELERMVHQQQEGKGRRDEQDASSSKKPKVSSKAVVAEEVEKARVADPLSELTQSDVTEMKKGRDWKVATNELIDRWKLAHVGAGKRWKPEHAKQEVESSCARTAMVDLMSELDELEARAVTLCQPRATMAAANEVHMLGGAVRRRYLVQQGA